MMLLLLPSGHCDPLPQPPALVLLRAWKLRLQAARAATAAAVAECGTLWNKGWQCAQSLLRAVVLLCTRL
jgi:hypothetical protein